MTAAPVWIERRTRPMTLNELIGCHLRVRRTHIREWRKWAEEEAKGHAPIAGPVVIVVQLRRLSGRSMPDAGSSVLAAKAVVDGLVDAGVLPGDGPAVVRSLTFEAPLIAGYDGLRVIVRPVEEHVTRPQPAPSTGPLTLPVTDPGATAA